MSDRLRLSWLDGGEASPQCANGICRLPESEESHSLFSPVMICELRLKNRFAMAPMSLQRSPGGIPGADIAAYYARRAAEGGAGLIITETTSIDHSSNGLHLQNMPRLRRGTGESSHARLASAVHEQGSKIFVQLFHPGATDMGPPEPKFMRSPSGHYWPPSIPRGFALSQSEIDELVDAFADAAVLAENLGYDGVEVHAAHGYLVDEFLWAVTNGRDDEYGGTPTKRARFLAEIVAAIRSRTSRRFQIGCRISQWKTGVRGAYLAPNPLELKELLTPVCAAGVDLFHVSTRHFNDPGFASSNLSLAGWVRTITGKPVITVGGIGLDSYGNPDLSWDFSALNTRFKNGEFDLVAVGQALLYQSNWVSHQSARFGSSTA